MTSEFRRDEQKGKSFEKLLNGRYFLLEINNPKERERVRTSVEQYGGRVMELFEEERPPMVVVSDHLYAVKIEKKLVNLEQPSDRLLKALPALLREAVRRKIKVRTVGTFLKQLRILKEKCGKSASATSNLSAVKEGMERRQSCSDKASVRIELPGRRPDIRDVERASIRHIHAGEDAGFSIFRRAPRELVAKRRNDYEKFVEGRFKAPRKNVFKLEEKENFCQLCNAHADNWVEHEKTDAHRNRAKTNGLVSELERCVMMTKMQMERKRMKTERIVADTAVDWEYGENALVIKWDNFRGESQEAEQVEEPMQQSENVIIKPSVLPRTAQERELLLFTGNLT